MEIEDNGVAILKMKNGSLGTLHYTINAFNKNKEGSFTLIGEKGTIKIGGEYLNTLEWYDVNGSNNPILKIDNKPNDYGFYQGSMSNHDKVYKDLIDSLNGKGNLVDANEAIKTIEIIEKIYGSTKEA